MSHEKLQVTDSGLAPAHLPMHRFLNASDVHREVINVASKSKTKNVREAGRFDKLLLHVELSRLAQLPRVTTSIWFQLSLRSRHSFQNVKYACLSASSSGRTFGALSM